MTLPEVDPKRFEAEWAEDQEVLASLAKNGDRPELVRSVDVSFRGSGADLDRLEDDAESLASPCSNARKPRMAKWRCSSPASRRQTRRRSRR